MLFNFNKNVVHALLFALTLPALARAASIQSPNVKKCSLADESIKIEILPITLEGSTRDSSVNHVTNYSPNSACRVPKVDYSGKDIVYKVWLHPGNRDIRFFLDVNADNPKADNPDTDLVLALIRSCDDGTTCASSSIDFIGTHDEEIPPASYLPGFYYLYVDSLDDEKRGPFKLTVTGENPTPDLVLELSSSPNPVVAGNDLTYTLTVTNKGNLDATGVKVIQTLPKGVSHIRLDQGCSIEAQTITCEVKGSLAIGAKAQWNIVVRVDPATRGVQIGHDLVLINRAEATANEGDPTSPNIADPPTVVEAKADLSFSRADPWPEKVVAGTPLTYSIKVHNDGPSDATSVVVTHSLPSGTTLKNVSLDNVSPEGNCKLFNNSVACNFRRIFAHKNSPLITITVMFEPWVKDSSRLSTTADVSANEPEPDPNVRPNSALFETTAVRHASLSISKEGPSQIFAGEDMSYTVTVSNGGLSYSSGATITDRLPPGLTFLGPVCPSNDDIVTCCSNDKRTVVTCPIPEQAPGSFSNATFKVHAVSSLASGTIISNSADVTAQISTESAMMTSNPRSTSVAVKADLNAQKSALHVSSLTHAESVCPGENLLYTVAVTNCGPSNSRSAMMTDMLDPRLSFLASPDGCWEKGGKVMCTVRPLEPVEPAATCPPSPTKTATMRYVVQVDSKAMPGPLKNTAFVNGEDDGYGLNSGSAEVQIEPSADLAVAFSNPPDLLTVIAPPYEFTYTLSITNAGPSSAKNVTITLTPPVEVSFLSADCGTSPGVCIITVGNLAVGATRKFDVQVRAPDDRVPNPIKTIAVVKDKDTCDPKAENNTATAITTLAKDTEADLSLAKTASAETVMAGDLLRYTLEVTNHGPAAATNVTVEDKLPGTPDTLEFVPETTPPPTGRMCCSYDMASHVVTCDFGSVDKNPPASCSLTVRVKPTSTNYLLHNTANILAPVPDLNPDPNSLNNGASTSTTVLSNSLILPSFKAKVPVNAAGTDIDTLLAVRNPSDTDYPCVRLDYFIVGPPGTTICQNQPLQKKETLTQSLSEVFFKAGLNAGLKEGYVGITPVDACLSPCVPTAAPSLPTPAPLPPLSGDFIRVEPASGHATGQPLVATDPLRSPPELCRSWSTRFLNGGSFGGSTEFLFFVPGNPGGSTPVAVGKVYNEAGQFVQEISVTAIGEAFQRTTQAEFDHGIPLLASFGAIEWEFPQGVVGNISTIHRNQDKYSVAVPGFCRRTPPGTQADLIVPYFEVDSDNENGTDTLFAVHNESAKGVPIEIKYFSAAGASYSENLTLDEHATKTVSLYKVAKDNGEMGPVTGYVQIAAEASLSGDFVRIDTVAGLASGGVLVDADPNRSPKQLCHKWSVRFLQGDPESSTTDFVFYIQNGGSGSVTGQVYSEAGTLAGSLRIPIQGAAFQVQIKDAFFQPASQSAQLPKSGSIEWDLGSLTGNLASVLKAGGSSVLVPGVCIPP